MIQGIFSGPRLHRALSMVLILLYGCTIYSEKSLPDLQPHTSKPILFLQGAVPAQVSFVFWGQLGKEVEESLSENPWLGPIKGKSEQQIKWQNDQQLRLDQLQFKASLSLAGIPERLLSARLMKSMEVSQTILFQFVVLPCAEECTSQENWLMRLQLLDLESGVVVHRVRVSYKPYSVELSGKSREEAARSPAHDLVKRFNASFVVPWHRLRYENLKSFTSAGL